MGWFEFIWGAVGIVAIVVAFKVFGFKGAFIALLSMIGVKVINDAREKGAEDERQRQQDEISEIRKRHEEISGESISVPDAYDELRGMRRDDN